MPDDNVVNIYGKCPICNRWIGSHGRYNHNMMHVRKGEMTVEVDSVEAMFIRYGNYNNPLARYVFRLVKKDAINNE